VVQVVKLIPKSFDGNPKYLREFCEGVEVAKQVVHPTEYPLLLKFIESKITGEAKDRLLARAERNTWEQVKDVLLIPKVRSPKRWVLLRAAVGNPAAFVASPTTTTTTKHART
jgi:hypothetical protein